VLLDRGMMGDGVADLKALRRAVEEAGYTGHCEVEVLSANNWWKRDPMRFWTSVSKGSRRFVEGRHISGRADFQGGRWQRSERLGECTYCRGSLNSFNAARIASMSDTIV
jgi:hypothetical protein